MIDDNIHQISNGKILMNSLSLNFLHHCQSMQRKTKHTNRQKRSVHYQAVPTKLIKINTANLTFLHSAVSPGSSGWFVLHFNRSDWVFSLILHLFSLLRLHFFVQNHCWLQILVAFPFVWERPAPPARLKLFCRWICSRHIDPFVPASCIPQSGNPEAYIFLALK